jgi:hypothetical protein
MKIESKLVLLAFACLAITGCSKDNEGKPNPSDGVETVVVAGDSAAIISKIADFRDRAGKFLNVTPGATKGRREINWDAVPADLLNKNSFPLDFFGAADKSLPDGRKRGIVFTPANASLRVSDNNYADIDPAYGTQFSAFSKSKLFMSIGSVVTEFEFKVPGTTTPAYVTSFGVVFTDVDNPDATVVEMYEGKTLIGKVKATAADKKFSFAGLHAQKRKITSVRIISGNKAIAPGVMDGVTNDVVAMDDFIYSEPKAY